MTLIVVAAPDNESDIALIACVLEANDIPHFIQGSGFGGLFPGPQINGYNSRRVMVPASCVERAVELLSELNLVGPVPVPRQPEPSAAGRSRAAMILESLFLGWFVPSRPPRPREEE